MKEATAPFPKVDRVVYGRNPLNQVVCQVRFPALLRLQAQAPFEFQEAVQGSFPIYGEPQSAIEMPAQLLDLLPPPPRSTVHRFQSEDSNWTLSADPSFVALTCSEYKSWEEFSRKLFEALGHFCRIYKPSFMSRIGLRYQNLIHREWVEKSVGWDELISPRLVGPLADRELEERLSEASTSLRISIGSLGDAVRLQYGLAHVEGDDQRRYLLDFDYYYDQKVELEEAENVISRLYGYSGPAFQWAITPKLHAAMEPNE